MRDCKPKISFVFIRIIEHLFQTCNEYLSWEVHTHAYTYVPRTLEMSTYIVGATISDTEHSFTQLAKASSLPSFPESMILL